DSLAVMLEEERATFLDKTKEIRSALVKLCRISNKTINSSTKLLPRWKEIVVSLNLPAKQIPRDVKTRWNSTFDLLNVAFTYKAAIVQL
ncbi:hypothetical protein BT96DRAFT_765905, partial [Gymnopus androsaceus JB14]